MLQLCLFGGHAGQMGPETKIYLTMFGGCGLRRPTLARQLLGLRQSVEAPPSIGRKVIITAFGVTAVEWPTLAEEFIDLREATRSGALDINRWDRYMAELARWERASITSFTIFGGFDEADLPSEDDEVEALALQHHLGNINDESERVLEMGVGQSGSQRRAVVRQAVMVS
jgi:hypothetical protein